MKHSTFEHLMSTMLNEVITTFFVLGGGGEETEYKNIWEYYTRVVDQVFTQNQPKLCKLQNNVNPQNTELTQKRLPNRIQKRVGNTLNP